MRKIKPDALFTAGAKSRWRTRALSVLRPGVEAALLAAVALGVAQAGWSALSPHDAGASGAGPSDTAEPMQRADLRSPFAPMAGVAGASNAAAALAASVQLAGVRMATDPARSGAMLTMEDGAQRAFVIGQEVAPGLRLAEVRPDYVLLSHAGGQSRVALQSAAPGYSFARALMGEAPAPPASAMPAAQPQTAAAPVTEAAPQTFAAAPQTRTPVAPAAPADAAPMQLDEAAWLATTLGNVVVEDGETRGWRVSGEVPARVAQSGLQDGDVITTINGASPANGASVMQALDDERVVITVLRNGGERVTLTLAKDART